ncbi:MAG: TonB-dependent receptor plug domain-containing protein [Paludibacteraceae bacterium]|nr:TonB-dependent receptor plug domain-containing protein [Paludibacteraceae bacterium]
MRHIIFLLTLLCSAWLAAKPVTVSGYVVDAQSGERLIGAAVMDTITRQGTVTNSGGYFSLPLTGSEAAIRASYVGYAPSGIQSVRLNRDTLLRIVLKENTQLQELTVVAEQPLSGAESVQMSVVEVPVQQIKGIPALAGEIDVMKAIQLLPGVQSGTEGSAGLYVRGGGSDENLIILDDVPLYNVNHMLGFFSVFNAEAIKNVTLYKGSFPARYGSRLSSVVDVRQRDGNQTGWHGTAMIGLISAKVNIEGPIPWNKEQVDMIRRKELITRHATTFSVSARRTYYDLFMAPITAAVIRNQTDGQNATAGYFFYDVNAKLTHRFDENDKLSASFYMGDDEIYVRYKAKSTPEDPSKAQMRLNWDWGNLLAALNWEHRFSSQIFSTTQLSYTRYRYDLRQSLNYEQTNPNNAAALGEKMDYKSYVNDLMLQTQFSYVPSTQHDLHWGGNYIFHRFRPQVTSFDLSFSGSQALAVDTLLTDGEVSAHEASLFVEDTYTPLSWLRLNLGLRGSLYAIQGKVYPSLEPRIGIRALAFKGFAIKAGYSYMSQYVHMLSNSSVSLPTDLWVPVTRKILPMRSMQVAAGLNYDVLGHVELSVEGYYKRMINLIEYRDGASFIGTTQGWEEKVCMGDGWSYGVEFLAQRKTGKLTGWIGYTWSRSMRQFNREGQTINFGKPFHAKYDREHDVSITLQYAATKYLDLSATFVYGTGTRATLGTQTYYDPLSDKTITYIPERNNYRMPDYHRLDIGATIHYPIKRHPEWQSIWNVSIYNVYNNMNPFLLYQDEGSMYKISIFPLLPSVSYTFKF